MLPVNEVKDVPLEFAWPRLMATGNAEAIDDTCPLMTRLFERNQLPVPHRAQAQKTKRTSDTARGKKKKRPARDSNPQPQSSSLQEVHVGGPRATTANGG